MNWRWLNSLSWRKFHPWLWGLIHPAGQTTAVNPKIEVLNGGWYVTSPQADFDIRGTGC